MSTKWQRRDRKLQSRRKFQSDNRIGVRNIQRLIITQSQTIKSQRAIAR